MVINEKHVKKIEAHSSRKDLTTGKRSGKTDWRVTVQFADGSHWNDGGHSSKQSAIAYASRYAR